MYYHIFPGLVFSLYFTFVFVFIFNCVHLSASHNITLLSSSTFHLNKNNATKDSLQVEESQKNYLKTYPQPSTKPSRYMGSTKWGLPFEEHYLVALGQNDDNSAGENKENERSNERGPIDEQENENDSHYNPDYKEDSSKSKHESEKTNVNPYHEQPGSSSYVPNTELNK